MMPLNGWLVSLFVVSVFRYYFINIQVILLIDIIKLAFIALMAQYDWDPFAPYPNGTFPVSFYAAAEVWPILNR